MTTDRNCARLAAFTLVELLVVVAIISILAAMLLPALEEARISAKQAACMSNERQYGVALTMYGNDHRGRLPPHKHQQGVSEQQTILSMWDCVPGTFQPDFALIPDYVDMETVYAMGCPFFPDMYFTSLGSLPNPGHRFPYMYLANRRTGAEFGGTTDPGPTSLSSDPAKGLMADVVCWYDIADAWGINHATDNVYWPVPDPTGAAGFLRDACRNSAVLRLDGHVELVRSGDLQLRFDVTGASASWKGDFYW